MTTRHPGNLLTAREAAAVLRLSPGTLANWRVERKGLRFYRIGSRIRYHKVDVEAFANRGLVPVSPVRRDGPLDSCR